MLLIFTENCIDFPMHKLPYTFCGKVSLYLAYCSGAIYPDRNVQNHKDICGVEFTYCISNGMNHTEILSVKG